MQNTEVKRVSNRKQHVWFKVGTANCDEGGFYLDELVAYVAIHNKGYDFLKDWTDYYTLQVLFWNGATMDYDRVACTTIDRLAAVFKS